MCRVHLTSSPAALRLCAVQPACGTGLVSVNFGERTLYLGQDGRDTSWGFFMKSDLSMGRSVAVLWLHEDVIRGLARWATQFVWPVTGACGGPYTNCLS